MQLMRFPVNFSKRGLRQLRWNARNFWASAGRIPRICFRIIGLSTVLALSACSAVKLAYNQAPDLAYWYFDAYVDFNEVQSRQIKGDLEALLSWHRQTQLPDYIALLQKTQGQMRADITPPEACMVFSEVRRHAVAVYEQAEPSLAKLVVTLQNEQLVQMQEKFKKINADYRDDFMEGSVQSLREDREKQLLKRFENLYGRLDDQQIALLGQRVAQSPFDATRSYTERLRRQKDALQTFAKVRADTANAPNLAQKAQLAQPALMALFERSLNSPDAAYRVYAENLTKDGCQIFADVHQTTSAAQRAKAVQSLAAYEKDLRILAAVNTFGR